MSNRAASIRGSKRQQPQRWNEWEPRDRERGSSGTSTPQFSGESHQAWKKHESGRGHYESRSHDRGGRYEVNGGPGESSYQRRAARQELRGVDVSAEGSTTVQHGNRASASKEMRKPLERQSYSEDSRLSHLLRRVSREDDRERRLNTARQLREFIQQPDNRLVLFKQLDNVLAVLEDVVNESSKLLLELRQEAAACLGLLCCTLGYDAEKVFTWIFGKFDLSSKDDVKMLYLCAVHRGLEAAGDSKTFTSVMPSVMSSLQSILENVDPPDLLCHCVHCILLLARSYPHVFSTNFRDTVDILVGWHIDHTQTSSLTQKVSGWLQCLEQFWVADLAFSITLLGQFLEDMEAYAEDLRHVVSGDSVDEEVPPPSVSLPKLAALLRVFSTVVRSIGERFNPIKGPPITEAYVTEILQRVVICVSVAKQAYFSEAVMTAGNECVCVLLGSLEPELACTVEGPVEFGLSQLEQPDTYAIGYTVSILNLIALIVEQFGSKLPSSFVEKLFSRDSNLLKLRLHRDNQVVKAALSVYQSVLGLKNIPVLESAYRLILGEVACAVNSLLASLGADDTEPVCVDLLHPSFAGTLLSADMAEAALVFNLCALTTIGNAKNSIIGMWALSPTVFALLSENLTVVHLNIALNFPAVQYAVLYTLYSHCTRHEHFISSSLSSLSPSLFDGAVISTVTMATKRHFSTIINLLGSLLCSDKLAPDSRQMLLTWAQEIAVLMKKSDTYSPLFSCSAFHTFVKGLLITAMHEEPSFCLQSCSSLQILASSLPHDKMQRCAGVCQVQLFHTAGRVKQAFGKLLKALPIDIVLCINDGGCRGEVQSVSLGLRTHMARPASGTFHPHDFSDILAFILYGTLNRSGKDPWLERLYHSCQRQDKVEARASVTQQRLLRCEAALWLWAVWEAAQFTVLSKLRTPLGRAQDTFQTIEGAVRSLAGVALNPEGNGGGSWTHAEADEGHSNSQLRLTLLLHYLEALEKLMYNAYEGCASALMPPPKAIRTFFFTNRQTCQDWLTRIRLAAMRVGLLAGQPAVTVRHGYHLLAEMKAGGTTQGGEFESAVMMVVEALRDLRCPDAITGMAVWCAGLAAKNLQWIGTVALHAEGRFEKAAMDYQEQVCLLTGVDCSIRGLDKALLRLANPSTSTTSPKHTTNGMRIAVSGEGKKTVLTKPSEPPWEMVGYLASRTAECYMALSDWQAVQEWQTSAAALKPSTAAALALKVDMNYIRALSRFEDGDFTGCREQLDLLPGEGLSITPKTVKEKMDFKKLLPSVLSPDPTELHKAVETQLMRAATCFVGAARSDGAEQEGHLAAVTEQVSKYLKQTAKLTVTPLRLSLLSLRPWLPALSTLQLYSTSSLQNTIANQMSTKECLVPVTERVRKSCKQQDVRPWLQALRYASFQQALAPNLALTGPTIPVDLHVTELRLTAAKFARKRGNVALATRLLTQAAGSSSNTAGKGAGVAGEVIAGTQDLADLLSGLTLKQDHGGMEKWVAELDIEKAKLLYCMGQTTRAMEMLSLCALSHCSGPASQACARSLLTLTKWLYGDWKEASVHLRQVFRAQLEAAGGALSPLGTNISTLAEASRAVPPTEDRAPSCPRLTPETSVSVGVGESDVIMGQLYQLTAMRAPESAKAWASLGSWAYRWGRKVVDNSSQGASIPLLGTEKAEVETLLPACIPEEERALVYSILGQAVCRATGLQDEELSVQTPESDEGGGAEAVEGAAEGEGEGAVRRRLLAACPALADEDPETALDGLLSVWRAVAGRIFGLYKLSCRAYFIFLRLNAGQVGADGEDLSKTSAAAPDNRQQSGDDLIVMATLRLLRLLVKHAAELREELEHGLATTPTSPWRGIIPQLFSRLNHPEAYVRQSICNLLCRVAQDSPHLVLYPAIVGSVSLTGDAPGSVGGRMSALPSLLGSLNEREGGLSGPEGAASCSSQADGEGTEALPPLVGASSQDQAMMQDCYSKIVDKLMASSPTMVSQVQLLVSELRRITVLWDELWLGVLLQQQMMALRRVQQLEDEGKRVQANVTLRKEEKLAIMREKHTALMKPVVFALEHAHSITSAPPETPHERWFQDTYGASISAALERLKNPPNPASPGASWAPFRQLLQSLQQRAQKRTSYLLRLAEMSPRLSALAGTEMALPGESHAREAVCVHSLAPSVSILPTKTKPKKLSFLASDGNTYTYLFKGLEDLHLDERIMQFLSIVNNMFVKGNGREWHRFHARHYSVTPLGSRSGLIQWVDGATPLFGLYKRWQQRETLTAGHKTPGGEVLPPTGVAVPRPSDLFYGKMTPALRAAGLNSEVARREWPLSTMRSVLLELMDETPPDLLARELWCSSASPDEWWRVTQMYCRSTAVMSMVGYIIGLGDRHLDNVLIDMTTGEVVHIDYNVCFEKGKSLRVPEKVPFRMTQNIERALGVTGVEGIFRLSCEQILQIMRRGRETLLTLLEAFVYDPLVDWTAGGEAGFAGAVYGGGGGQQPDSKQSKRDMERDITRSLFSSRVAEIKVSWFRNRDEMLAVLPRLKSGLEAYVCLQDTLTTGQCLQDKLLEQLEYLEKASRDAKHPAHSLHNRYEEYARLETQQQAVHEAVTLKLSECEAWSTQYMQASSGMEAARLGALLDDIATPIDLGPPSYVPATGFLQSAGQAQVIAQSEAAECELVTALQQRRGILRGCLEALHNYAAVGLHYPRAAFNTHRAHRWACWLQALLCEGAPTRCQEIYASYEDAYLPQPGSARAQWVFGMEAALQLALTELNGRLLRQCERLKQEGAVPAACEEHTKEVERCIQVFLDEDRGCGSTSLASVIVGALSTLTRRSLHMERAASGAGDQLADLTSRDGDWFLEELCSMSGNVASLVQLLAQCKLRALRDLDTPLLHLEATTAVFLAHSVYTSLQELNTNFRQIIFPEALRCLLREEESLEGLLAELGSLVEQATDGAPLQTLIDGLHGHLRNKAMGIEDEAGTHLVSIVRELRVQYGDFIQPRGHDGGVEDPPKMSAGQMLLMAFDGMFAQVDSSFTQLTEQLVQLEVPAAWRKVDVLREARALQAHIIDLELNRRFMQDVFFLKRLQTIQEFFTQCRAYAQTLAGIRSMEEGGGSIIAGSFNGPSLSAASKLALVALRPTCLGEEQLARPVKAFTADFVRMLLVGLPTQALGLTVCSYLGVLGLDVTAQVEARDFGAESKVSVDELCKKVADLSLQQGRFSTPDANRAAVLASSFDAAWKRQDLARRLDGGIASSKDGLQRLQIHVAMFQWLHEDVLMSRGQPMVPVGLPRTGVLANMKKKLHALTQMETSIAALQERVAVLEGSIEQRLKWAGGANPALAPVLQDFEATICQRRGTLLTEKERVSKVTMLCGAVLHFESLRTRTPESSVLDKACLELLQRCQGLSSYVAQCSNSVSPLELQLLRCLMMSSPPQPVGSGEWLLAAHRHLSADLAALRTAQADKEQEADAALDGLQELVDLVKMVLTGHNKLLSDVKYLLKTMAKDEEAALAEGEASPYEGSVREFLAQHRAWQENMQTVLFTVLQACDQAQGREHVEMLQSIAPSLEELAAQSQGVYHGLVSFASPLVTDRATECASPTPAPALPPNILAVVRSSSAPVQKTPSEGLSPSAKRVSHKGGAASGNSPPGSKLPAGTSPRKTARDPKTGKAVQERNSYAVSVWKRVKAKLEGRDVDPSRRMTVTEQVDYVIKEATSLDNLAQLYEGWTAWV
ncbi:serine/threonine-protein kinase SMG1 isoform X1 [Petromyzon marinus]|uniref:non-specific serine/threonine protein kinase n=1 Tax=Petromyzon marinus TaxID=7757 RepID=A0AAJ7TGJ6_PETMA|nr:serine/threonine-protein kinase SMG1 isoform X1 [Petromyzon marinus]